MVESGAVSVTMRAETPEQCAMAIAEDVDEFLGERGLSFRDVTVLQATQTEVEDGYVHTLVMAYALDPQPMVQNVPMTRETQRLRRVAEWSSREIRYFAVDADRQLLAAFLSVQEPLLDFFVAPFWGVFERGILRMLCNDREGAIATVTINNQGR